MRRSLLGCACALGVLGQSWLAGEVTAAEPPGQLLAEQSEARQVAVGQIRREVEVQLQAARQLMAADSAQAVALLKELDLLVRSAQELDAAERAPLLAQVSDTLRAAVRQEAAQLVAAQQRRAAQVAARERQHVLASLESQQMRLTQLTDRFLALLDEGRFELAEEVAGIAAVQAADTSPLAAALPVKARLQKNQHEAHTTRIARQQGVVATLHRAEVAHIPQSDEPPIVYVDAPVWQELTLRRRDYAVTDLYEEKPAEKRIRQALDDVTDVEFVEAPLSDVIDYLKDRHGIEIQLDTRALEANGTGSETPVTISLRGITLRSALRLLLRQFDLTYTIQDEVLLITTPDVAATIMVPRVYKVADLVLPIENLSGFGQLGGGMNNSLFGVNPGQNQQGQQGLGNNLFNNNQNPFGNGQF